MSPGDGTAAGRISTLSTVPDSNSHCPSIPVESFPQAAISIKPISTRTLESRLTLIRRYPAPNGSGHNAAPAARITPVQRWSLPFITRARIREGPSVCCHKVRTGPTA